MWTHTDGSFIFLDSRNNALVMHLLQGQIARIVCMEIFQCIVFCVIISILPPVTWIYSLIHWVLGGCRVKSFTLEDVTICECSDNDMDFEDFVVLEQMLDDYMLKLKAKHNS